MYLDPNRKDIKCNTIFNIIQDISGITKEQIKSKSRKEEIVFARQLFQYGFMELKIGGLVAAGKETNNNHSTVSHSIDVIQDCIDFGNGWRKKMYLEFMKEIKEKVK